MEEKLELVVEEAKDKSEKEFLDKKQKKDLIVYLFLFLVFKEETEHITKRKHDSKRN